MSYPKKYLQEKEVWYEKLRESGFKDVESFTYRDHSQVGLKNQKSGQHRISELDYEIRVEFYRRASQFYWDFTFPDETTKHMWELFSEGKTYREIASQVGMKHVTVFRRIRAIIQNEFRQYQNEVFSNETTLMDTFVAGKNVKDA